MSKKRGNIWKKKWFLDGKAAFESGLMPSCCPVQPISGGTAYHLWMDGYNTAKTEAMNVESK